MAEFQRIRFLEGRAKVRETTQIVCRAEVHADGTISIQELTLEDIKPPVTRTFYVDYPDSDFDNDLIADTKPTKPWVKLNQKPAWLGRRK